MANHQFSPDLKTHLVAEFGERGQRAVEFLDTAEAMIALDQALLPRLAESVAYCLREAMKEIPAAANIGGAGRWDTLSRKVAAAKCRFVEAAPLDPADGSGQLDLLLSAIDDMDEFHEQRSLRQRQMAMLILQRTGIEMTEVLLSEYQSVVRGLDKALHGTTVLADVSELLTKCASILRKLFLPPETRRPEIEELAALRNPQPEDMDRLGTLISTPRHLQHFFNHAVDVQWLPLIIDDGLLEPPKGNQLWPMFAAVDRFISDEPKIVEKALSAMCSDYKDHPEQSWFVANAALRAGEHSFPIVHKILAAQPASEMVISLALEAIDRVPASDEFVKQVADLLLNETCWEALSDPEFLTTKLEAGVTQQNAVRRIELLVSKINKVPKDDPAWDRLGWDQTGSISDDRRDYEGKLLPVLISCLVEVLRNSCELVALTDILDEVDKTDTLVSNRLRPWILRHANSAAGLAVSEVSNGIEGRQPHGDDLQLIDSLASNGLSAEHLEVWADALGTPPTSAEVKEALSSDQYPADWIRISMWVRLLPEQAISKWTAASNTIRQKYGIPGRETYRCRTSQAASGVASPYSNDDLTAVQPLEAAEMVGEWRPDPDDTFVATFQLRQVLKAVISEDVSSWASEPMAIATALSEPTYISEYLWVLADSKLDDGPAVGELLDVANMAQEPPWPIAELGRDEFDYDKDWSGVERASIALIESLARNQTGFAGRNDEVWEFLDSSIRRKGEPLPLPIEGRVALDVAANRTCVVALEALLWFSWFELQIEEEVRTDRLISILQESLELEGFDGVGHRAGLARHLDVLGVILPEWMDQLSDVLVGSDAPGSLAQTFVDQAIKWSAPRTWILENCRDQVLSAAERQVDRAPDHIMNAMFSQCDGYSVDEVARLLGGNDELVSESGKVLGRLLRQESATQEHLETGVAYWNAIVAAESGTALRGFGWLSAVETIDDSRWAELMLNTLQKLSGSIDRDRQVSGHLASMEPTTTTLQAMNRLVRGNGTSTFSLQVGGDGARLLEAAKHLDGTAEFGQLSTALAERGLI